MSVGGEGQSDGANSGQEASSEADSFDTLRQKEVSKQQPPPVEIQKGHFGVWVMPSNFLVGAVGYTPELIRESIRSILFSAHNQCGIDSEYSLCWGES